MPTWCHRQFFWRYRVSLVKFSYWSSFHVNITTGSRVITIFVYKGLTRNTEIGNNPVWILPNIWRLGRVKDTKFDTNTSNKKLLNAAKCQSYNFYRFWVIKGKPTGERKTYSRKKIGAFIVPFILSEGNFFEVFYLNVLCIEYTFRIYMLLHIKKITSYTFAACF